MKQYLFCAVAALAVVTLGATADNDHPTPRPAADEGNTEQTYQLFIPAVFRAALTPPFDMAQFMIGDRRLYEVQHSGGSQARHQTQVAGDRFYHTKGDELSAEWEELWATEDTIYRGTDTSPGNGQYYTLYDGEVVGSAWSPRFWDVGDLYERNPFVVFYRKNDCDVVVSGFQRSWLRFEAYYPTYTFRSGIKLNNVVELSWLLRPDGQPVESYFYAEGLGLVGWGSDDRGFSYISWIHEPGQRPDNKREVISCLSETAPGKLEGLLNEGPLPPGYRAK